MILLLVRWRVVRISSSSSYFGSAQEVVDELKVGGNELKGVNGFGTVFTVVLVMARWVTKTEQKMSVVRR